MCLLAAVSALHSGIHMTPSLLVFGTGLKTWLFSQAFNEDE